MGPFTFCVLALVLAAANAQTTQAFVPAPTLCMRTNASESTGEVWAEMAFCRWNNNFHLGAPDSDQTIRSSEGQCLVGGSEGEGASFKKCEEGDPLQKWEFVVAGATANQLAAADGPDNVPGQIVLASADANMNRPKMCLKGNLDGEGARVTVVPCDGSYEQLWAYAAPPPSNKVLLVMPARHAAGEEACVQMATNRGEVQIGDCDDEDLVGNWWVRDGELIRMAAVKWCLTFDGGYAVDRNNCGPNDSDYNSWSLGEDGSLTLTTQPDKGCLTYDEESQVAPLQMQPCTGDGKQTFAFLSDAPATDAVQVA